MKPLRAKYENGVLKLLEPLYVEEGAEVIVSVELVPKKATEGSESILEMFQRLRDSMPPDAWDNMPTDFVKNKKHYLYGYPKEEDEE